MAQVRKALGTCRTYQSIGQFNIQLYCPNSTLFTFTHPYLANGCQSIEKLGYQVGREPEMEKRCGEGRTLSFVLASGLSGMLEGECRKISDHHTSCPCPLDDSCIIRQRAKSAFVLLTRWVFVNVVNSSSCDVNLSKLGTLLLTGKRMSLKTSPLSVFFSVDRNKIASNAARYWREEYLLNQAVELQITS